MTSAGKAPTNGHDDGALDGAPKGAQGEAGEAGESPDDTEGPSLSEIFDVGDPSLGDDDGMGDEDPSSPSSHRNRDGRPGERRDGHRAHRDGTARGKAASQGKAPGKEGSKGRRGRKKRPKDDKRVSEQRRKHRRKVALVIALATLAAIVIAAVVTFCVFRWGYFDDATDIEGEWRIDGNDSTVLIEDGRFVLTDEISYEYEIDPFSKTLTFEFGNLDGSARYRFSTDRDHLALQDGDFDAMTNLTNDIPWTIEALIDCINGSEAKDPTLSSGGMTLERVG